MISFAPVFGFRPSRFLRSRTTKLPNGISCTLSPLMSALRISSSMRSTTSPTWRFESSDSSAKASTSSAFVNVQSPKERVGCHVPRIRSLIGRPHPPSFTHPRKIPAPCGFAKHRMCGDVRRCAECCRRPLGAKCCMRGSLGACFLYTNARRARRYESTPKPAIVPRQTGPITLVARKGSRANVLVKWTSIVGIPTAAIASRSA